MVGLGSRRHRRDPRSRAHLLLPLQGLANTKTLLCLKHIFTGSIPTIPQQTKLN